MNAEAAQPANPVPFFARGAFRSNRKKRPAHFFER
jgi:hypothetical protein